MLSIVSINQRQNKPRLRHGLRGVRAYVKRYQTRTFAAFPAGEAFFPESGTLAATAQNLRGTLVGDDRFDIRRHLHAGNPLPKQPALTVFKRKSGKRPGKNQEPLEYITEASDGTKIRLLRQTTG
ncbi:MAG TPA: hypothetical protein VK742_03360 [Candidatus Sulfotelmatobacter sp.]|jgi:hypothetical protein|nr:hypothetical protein [Candidatus Sulfotelmatobacter sp.]